MNIVNSTDLLKVNITNASTATCIVVTAHDFVFDVVDTVRLASDTDIDELIRIVTPYGILGGSLLLCFFGYHAMRCIVGLAAFGTGLVGMVRLLHMSAHTMSCDVLTLVVFIGAAISALVAVLMTRTLSTLLGAAGACVVVGAAFATCGATCAADLWVGAPRFLGLSLVPFWTAMLVAFVLGAVVARKRHREVLATIAAVLGGFGVAVSTRTIITEHGLSMPDWAFLLVLGGITVVGLGTQYWCNQHMRVRRSRTRLSTRLPQLNVRSTELVT